MSGHSKWANIKNKKAKTDAVKGKIFTKIGREIAVAAKGNPDPYTNSKLADVIAKAKAANMPNDNIKRSIAKAAGELNSVNYENLTYEGYGIGGSAVILQEGAYAFTRKVHVGLRLQEPQRFPCPKSLGNQRPKALLDFPFRRKAGGQGVYRHEAEVMRGSGVFRARIAQSDKDFHRRLPADRSTGRP